jgi:CMP-N,N'-diacetyllegionaminic acid synthase
MKLLNVNEKNSLCFIPARGGSTRLPKKNIKKLSKKPLISYSIEAAIKSKCFNKIVVSTDDEIIAKIASKFSEVDVDNRPSYLATSTATALNTLLEYLERAKNQSDVITLMLPTCPFRSHQHIIDGFKLLIKNIDSVISVTPFSFPYEMSLIYKENTDTLKTFFDPSPLITGNTRSQDQRVYYHPNGGFYISWLSSLRKYGNFFAGKMKGYTMENINSHDIDTAIDFDIAEYIFKHHLS